MSEKRFPRMLRLRAVMEFSGLRTTQIYQKVKDGEFPKPVKLTESGRAVAWDEDELLAWREARLAARDAKVS